MAQRLAWLGYTVYVHTNGTADSRDVGTELEGGRDVTSDFADDGLHEECGIFGIYAPGVDVARAAFFGLFALQHRGQESAGIASSFNGEIRLRKRMGLVNQAFSEADLKHLRGDLAVGHTRYSTTGSSLPENAGPMAADSPLGTIVVAHNGNVVNTVELGDELRRNGTSLCTSTDSEVMTEVIANAPGIGIVEKVQRGLSGVVGAFSLAILTPNELVAVRDPNGIRPLCLGQLESGWVVASETCALSTVGATFVREIEPGEILHIGPDGLRSSWLAPAGEALCVFELIYFARPDSQLTGQRLHLVRQRMGAELAREHPVAADIVVGVPDSATPAAIGYARASGIEYQEAIIKNRYIGRTFIQPDQRLREVGVRLKLNVLPEIVAGQRVIVIDDTIVRGTTSRPMVNLLRQAGAREIHMLVHAPPIMWPCHLGVDMATRDELIAANRSVDEIADVIGVDSLGYLSLEGLYRAIGQPKSRFCSGCLTGEYPVAVPMTADKLALERTLQRV